MENRKLLNTSAAIGSRTSKAIAAPQPSTTSGFLQSAGAKEAFHFHSINVEKLLPM